MEFLDDVVDAVEVIIGGGELAFGLGFFCCLYFKTPAASSKIPRRSSGLLLKIASTRPWEIKEKLSLPSPESMNKSTMSLSRTAWLLMRKSDSPSRYSRRVMATVAGCSFK